MITVYGMGVSGNCHKVRLLLELLQREYEWIEIDSAHGGAKTPGFLAFNPNGKVPVVVIADAMEDDPDYPSLDNRFGGDAELYEGGESRYDRNVRLLRARVEGGHRDPPWVRGEVLTESNAILYYLAQGTPWFGGNDLQRARTLAWMFFEQYSHEPYVAVARFIRGWTEPGSERRGAELARCMTRGDQALAVMENHLGTNDWFSATGCGIADIALHAYTHCAEDGGFDLGRYPGIVHWIARVEAMPGFVRMPPVSAEVTQRLRAWT